MGSKMRTTAHESFHSKNVDKSVVPVRRKRRATSFGEFYFNKSSKTVLIFESPINPRITALNGRCRSTFHASILGLMARPQSQPGVSLAHLLTLRRSAVGFEDDHVNGVP